MKRAVSLAEFRRLYQAGIPQTQIAQRLGVSQNWTHRMAEQLGLERPYPSQRVCRVCGEPVWKRRTGKIGKDGEAKIAGTRCLTHQLEYERECRRRSAQK